MLARPVLCVRSHSNGCETDTRIDLYINSQDRIATYRGQRALLPPLSRPTRLVHQDQASCDLCFANGLGALIRATKGPSRLTERSHE